MLHLKLPAGEVKAKRERPAVAPPSRGESQPGEPHESLVEIKSELLKEAEAALQEATATFNMQESEFERYKKKTDRQGPPPPLPPQKPRPTPGGVTGVLQRLNDETDAYRAADHARAEYEKWLTAQLYMHREILPEARDVARQARS